MWCVLARNRNKRAILSRSSVAAYFLFSWNVYLFGLFLCFCVFFFLSSSHASLFLSWASALTQSWYTVLASINLQTQTIDLCANKMNFLFYLSLFDKKQTCRTGAAAHQHEMRAANEIFRNVQVYYINRQPNDGIYICCGGKVAWQIFSLIPAEIEPNKLRARQQFFFFCSVMK